MVRNTPRTKTSRQPRLTLVELLMIIIVMGVLSAIAVPAYQDHQIRSKVNQLITTAEAAQSAIIEEMTRNPNLAGAFPSYTPTGFPEAPHPLVNRILVSHITPGAIIITGNAMNLGLPSHNTFNLVLTPTVGVNGNVRWACTYGKSNTSGTAKYAPGNCRTANGIDG